MTTFRSALTAATASRASRPASNPPPRRLNASISSGTQKMTGLLRSMRPIAAVFTGEATGAAWRLFWSFVVAVCLIGQAMAEPLEKTEIRYQGWAGQVTFTELAEDLGYLAPLKLKWVGNAISGPQDIQTVVTGDVDVGGAFYGAILKLIAAKAPIKAVVGYYGSDANTHYGHSRKEVN